MPTYRQILFKALSLTFRNPVLWFFGLLTAVLGTSGELGLLVQSSSLGDNQSVVAMIFSAFSKSGFFDPQSLLKLTQLMFSQPLVFLSTLFGFTLQLFLVVLFICLVVVSQIAVINGVVGLLKNKKASWLELFKSGLKPFWPVFWVNATFKIVALGSLSLLTAIGALAGLKFLGLTALFFIVFILLVWLLVIMSFLTKYLILFVVLKDQKVKRAAQEALRLFSQNWLLSLEVATILFFIYGIINYCFALVFEEFMLYILVTHSAAFGKYIFFGVTVFAIIQMFLALFNLATWTIVFQILTNKQLKFSSRLNNGFRRIFR